MELTTIYKSYKSVQFPNIPKPKICGSFSIDRDGDTPKREYVPDCSQLKFLKGRIATAGIRYDLNWNAKNTISRMNMEQDIGFMCHYLKDNNTPIDIFDSSKISLEDVPFVTYGESLKAISSFPYSGSDPVLLSVSLLRGVIYLQTSDTRVDVESQMTAKQKACFGWGYKFRQHILSDTFKNTPGNFLNSRATGKNIWINFKLDECNTQPDIEAPLNESKKFYLVHEAKLKAHKLVYATEIDAVKCEDFEEIFKGDLTLEKLKNLEFIQLKIAKHLTNQREKDLFMRHKAMAWWLDTFFTGIETVLCGHRSGDGIVTELKFYKAADLTGKYRKFWHPTVPMNFCDVFLRTVKDCLSKELLKHHGARLDDIRDLPRIDLVFTRQPRSDVVVSENHEKAVSILPRWYVDLLAKE